MIYVFLDNGFEEIEAMTPVDVLRRAGIEVQTVGVSSNEVKGCNGITVKCDIGLSETKEDMLEGVILPGGMPGTKNLAKSGRVQKLIMYCKENNKLIAAICAAPLILGHMGVLQGKTACCYPGFEDELSGAEVVYDKVCVSKNIITSRGPGTALEFALSIVKYLCGSSDTDKIRMSMQCI